MHILYNVYIAEPLRLTSTTVSMKYCFAIFLL